MHGFMGHRLKKTHENTATLTTCWFPIIHGIGENPFVCRRSGRWTVFWQCSVFFTCRLKEGNSFQNMDFYVHVTHGGSLVLRSIVWRFLCRGLL